MDNKKKASCALALIAVLALSCTQAFAQSDTTAPTEGASSGAKQEGVKVHGDWTLTMRNPDGTVAAVHEFKNALSINFGANALLAELLIGGSVAGHWSVTVGTGNSAACTPGVTAVCRIIENASPVGANSRDLTKTVPTSGPDAGKLVLRGSVRILADTQISDVGTTLGTCAPSVSPASCAPATLAPFTYRSFAPNGIPVSQDQLVEVKVVISFS